MPAGAPADGDGKLDYRGFFERSPWPIFVVARDSMRILAVNDAAVERYGYTREELLAMRATDLRPREDAEAFVEAFRALGPTRLAETPTPRTWRHRKKDGTIITVDVWRMNVMFGETHAHMALVQDVSTRVAMEEQLRQAQKMEAVGLLAGGIAHDFNNFLGIILGAAEVAERSVASGATDDAGLWLRTIVDAATRAAEVTKRILAFSRKQRLRLEVVDLSEAASEVASLFSRVVGEGISVDVRQAPRRLLVALDRAQLDQVLLNLCTNARQAVPSGGRIAIETCATTVDEAFVAKHPWARTGAFGELRVVDTGPGMDAETRGRAFEPFFTTREHGTGLGLATVYGIVQQHGGAIGIETSPGAGTTVRVLWPLVGESAENVAARATVVDPEGGRETILVAEDEPALREVIARSLRDLGYTVLVVEDGEAAMHRFLERRGEVALVVLDVVMPKMSGPEAFARMKAADPSARVVFMSGYAPMSRNLDALEHTAHAFLDKPFALKDLARAVRHVLDAPSTAAVKKAGVALEP